MSKYSASRTRGLVKMDVLTEGEENRPHRIRAATEIHEWLAALTATERGELLRQMYQAHLLTVEFLATPPTPEPRRRVLRLREGGPTPRLPLTPIELGSLPDLAVFSPAQRAVIDAMHEGAVLYRDGSLPLYELHWPDGRNKRVGSATVKALQRMTGVEPDF